MPSIRLVLIDVATGKVKGEWQGDAAQQPVAPAGRAFIEAPDGRVSYADYRWTGTAFEAIPAAPVRVLSCLDFARRFTLAEEGAIAALADSNRTVQAWMRRLTLADRIDLDHADVRAGLSYLKSIGVPSIWPDTATADRRLVEIRA